MAVTYERDGHIATITIDRQSALNTIDLEHWQLFSEATEQFNNDDEAWVGIITGAGPRAFCAGADVGSTVARLMDDPRNNPYDGPPIIMRGQQPEKPLIAAVNGLALGGGLEIALSCDLRIAASNARFGLPEVSLGLIPGWSGTQRLPRQIPWVIAARMIYTGDMINAEEAYRAFLVNEVVEPDELMDKARALAESIAAKGPLAVRAAKRSMLEGLQMPLEEGLALELQNFLDLAYTEDVREGIAAFQERRKPDFKAK